MRRTDHHGTNLIAVDAGGIKHRANRARDAIRDVLGRCRLDCRENVVTSQQRRVCVRSADVYADTQPLDHFVLLARRAPPFGCGSRWLSAVVRVP
ncbi:hypothetical protein D9M69_615910 [compost metagenome]